MRKIIDAVVALLGERTKLLEFELRESFARRYTSLSGDASSDFIRVYTPSAFQGTLKKFYRQLRLHGLEDEFLKKRTINIITDDIPMLKVLLKRSKSHEGFNIIYVSKLNDIVDSLNTWPVILVFYSDEELIRAVGILKEKHISYIPLAAMKLTARYFHKNKTALRVLEESKKLPSSKFDLRDFENIIQALELTKRVRGDIVEVGVYKGRSAQVICEYCKRIGSDKNIFLLDTYDGIVFKTAKTSSDISWYKTHQQASDPVSITDQVRSFLSGYDYGLVQADITQDSLPTSIKQVSFCNIDVDLDESTYCALSKIAPLIQPGGIIICEDAGHTPALAGAAYAVDRFIKSDLGAHFTPVYMWSGQYMMVRIS